MNDVDISISIRISNPYGCIYLHCVRMIFQYTVYQFRSLIRMIVLYLHCMYDNSIYISIPISNPYGCTTLHCVYDISIYIYCILRIYSDL